jgi:hypothetical protein
MDPTPAPADELPPPWRKYPQIPARSMGWRMGHGEDFWVRWHLAYGALDDAARAAYRERFPEPEDWAGFYDRAPKTAATYRLGRR